MQTTTGLLHMLEDGLVLAVLCQVHLLNNVGERQRPDLVFFNSFLIAFVTSFFAPDLSWSLLFVAHSFVLVPSLQLHTLYGHNRTVSSDTARSILRDSIPRTLTIGAFTAVVFLLWPRDFHRTGWLGDALEFGQQMQAGLSERIQLDRKEPMRLGDDVVARFEPVNGSIDQVPSHWRGTAFSVFDGQTWFPQDARLLGSRFASDRMWDRQRDGSWQRASQGTSTVAVHVRQVEHTWQKLLVPLHAERLALQSGSALLLDPKSHGGFGVMQMAGAPAEPLRYTVHVAQAIKPTSISPHTRKHFTDLPSTVPKLILDLAKRLRSRAPPIADHMMIAHTTRDWLEANRRYQLPGEPGFAANLGEFVLGTAAGHCEYFATTLALLLRVQGVPCRLVGGYLVHELDSDSGYLIARARHAHAWVEALDEVGKWHTLDATPAADVMQASQSEPNWWQRAMGPFDEIWAAITGFDAERRKQWLSALVMMPVRRPLLTGILVAGVLAVIYLRRRRRQRLPAIVAFERAVRACKLSLQRGETPRELVARAGATGVDADALERLRTAARQHELGRYRPTTSLGPAGRS